MQITVHRTGGIAGLNERLGPLDTTEHGGKIEAKLEEVHLFDLPPHVSGGAGADVRHMGVLVSDPPRAHEVTFSELSDVARACGLFDLIELMVECGAAWEQVRVPEPVNSAAS